MQVPEFISGVVRKGPLITEPSLQETEKQRLFPTDVLKVEVTLECTVKVPTMWLKMEDRYLS